jgi:hypothetical protein
MDRSHTMVSMRDGGLRLAVPTEEYAKMVHQAEQEVLFEEQMCGPMSYLQRHSRIEVLVEFAVWKHICKSTARSSIAQHANMLQGKIIPTNRQNTRPCSQEAGEITTSRLIVPHKHHNICHRQTHLEWANSAMMEDERTGSNPLLPQLQLLLLIAKYRNTIRIQNSIIHFRFQINSQRFHDLACRILKCPTRLASAVQFNRESCSHPKCIRLLGPAVHPHSTNAIICFQPQILFQPPLVR